MNWTHKARVWYHFHTMNTHTWSCDQQRLGWVSINTNWHLIDILINSQPIVGLTLHHLNQHFIESLPIVGGVLTNSCVSINTQHWLQKFVDLRLPVNRNVDEVSTKCYQGVDRVLIECQLRVDQGLIEGSDWGYGPTIDYGSLISAHDRRPLAITIHDCSKVRYYWLKVKKAPLSHHMQCCFLVSVSSSLLAVVGILWFSALV